MSLSAPKDIIYVLQESPLVPVFYHPDPSYVQSILKACYDGGMRVFEYTNRGEKAREIFPLLKSFVTEHCPGMLLGIGTIYKAEEADYFIKAGADFVVQPVTTAAVAEICHKHNIPWLPAGATLNEIYAARELGAQVVKVFPGNVLGPAFIKAIKGPMADAQLMVTGGVEPTEKSLQEWFGSGILAAGLGSQLFGNSVDTSQLADKIKSLLQFVKATRS